MTINSTIRKAGPFIGNGTASSFPFTYKVFQASDLDVVRLDQSTNVQTTLQLTTNYTVTLNQDQDSNPGGTVTLVAGPLATGYTLTMTSDVPNLQPTDLTNQGGFYPEVINDALDRATIQIQQLQEQTDRSLRLPLSSTADAELPPSAPNELIGWDATGNNLINVDPSSLASVAAYATAYCDVFVGNGITTSWTLTRNPAVLYNLDVSINGSTQEPTRDYTLSGTTFTMTTPPPIGARVVVKYKEGLPNATADSQDVRFVPVGTGAVNTTVQSRLRNVVSVTDFMTAAEIADARTSTPTLGVQAAVQKAVDYCLTFDPPAVLTVPVFCRLDAPVYIDRGNDAANASTYFIIKGDGIGGGFYAYYGGNMFSTTLTTGNPNSLAASQKIHFDNIVFKSQFPSNPTYVLDDAKFLRMKFTNCSFHRIKLLNATRYLQTYYLNNCMSYGWIGPFINGTNGAYDIKIDNHVAEAGTTFYSVVCNDVYSGDPNAQISITNSLFQSINSVCIQADRAQGFVVQNNYFEGNGQDGSPDLKFDTTRNLANFTANGSICITGNFFSQLLANFNDVNYYSIRWGRVVQSGFAAGNYLVDLGTGASLKLHKTIPESRVNFMSEPGWPYDMYSSQFVYPAAGYVMPNGNERVTFIRGVVQAAGGIKKGQGFTINKTGTGAYTINFATAFSDEPAVTVTVSDSVGVPLCVAVSSLAGSAAVLIRTPAGVATDCLFHFTAIGPV